MIAVARHARLRGTRASQGGVTIVELVVVMVILGIVTAMLLYGWIAMQRSFDFARTDNQARANGRDALDRVSSEIRAAQPSPQPSPTSTAPSTPFYFAGTAPYVCDAYDCTFYSAYNNGAGALGSPAGALALTSIWLDTSGSAPQKTLYWQRDTNLNGVLDAADRKVVLARNVANTAMSPQRPIFTYLLASADGATWTPTYTLTSANWTQLRSVQVDLVIDANLGRTPRYVEVMTTVQPRNQYAGGT